MVAIVNRHHIFIVLLSSPIFLGKMVLACNLDSINQTYKLAESYVREKTVSGGGLFLESLVAFFCSKVLGGAFRNSAKSLSPTP